MTRHKDLKNLERLTSMVLEMRLADLQQARSLRDKCEDQLKAMETPPQPSEALAGAATELAQLTYQRWVDLRREEINRQLAQRTADCLNAAQAAREAFSKNQALGKLSAKLPPVSTGGRG